MPDENITLGNIHAGGWRYRESENDFGGTSGRPELILTVLETCFSPVIQDVLGSGV